jgi:hypothetical protein
VKEQKNQSRILKHTHSANNQLQILPKLDLRYMPLLRYWEILSNFVIPISDQNKKKIINIIKIKTNHHNSMEKV